MTCTWSFWLQRTKLWARKRVEQDSNSVGWFFFRHFYIFTYSFFLDYIIQHMHSQHTLTSGLSNSRAPVRSCPGAQSNKPHHYRPHSRSTHTRDSPLPAALQTRPSVRLQRAKSHYPPGFTLPTVKRFSPTSGIGKPAVNHRKPLEIARNDTSNSKNR